MTLLLQGVEKINDSQDLASAGDQVPKQMWPCRGSILTNLNNCDFASVGSRKINDGQDLASVGDQVPKQMQPCFCRGSILTNLNNCDFASAGSRKIKNGQDLASVGQNKCDLASTGGQH